MGLFNFNYDRPGPGVDPDTPRKKGAARFMEVLARDLGSFWLAGALALIGALPYLLGLWFAIDTHALLPLFAAGILGGMIAAPQVCCLADTVLRSLRDEPGYFWSRWRRAWRQNARASLAPGALCGLLLAVQAFTFSHLDGSAGPLVGVALVVGVLALPGLAQYLFAQLVLLDMGLAGLLKNSLLLFLGFLPRTGLCVLWNVLYWGAVALFWPYSWLAMPLTGLWLPTLLSMMAIYPVLDKSFRLEERIKAMQDARREDEG